MDEDQLYLRPRNPPRYNEQHPTGSELEFIMDRSVRCAGNWRSWRL
jgi:hypothetical protein